MTRRRTFTLGWIALALTAGCGGDPPAVLTVGEVSYTEDDLLGLTDDRRRLLANLVGIGSAVADSSEMALGAPRVDEWVDDRRLEILAAELTLDRHGIDDAVLEAQYLVDPAWELTVRHILFFSERWRSADHRAEAEAKAGRAMESLRAGADFAETAAALSEEPGAEGRQGLLTPGREGSWVPEFWAAALALQPGDISPVTETEYGYHILRLEDRHVVPFEEGRSVVARSVADQLDDRQAVLDAWGDSDASPSARRLELLGEASARGVEVPPSERAELERTWGDTMYRWSAAFGFRFGMSPSELRTTALEALSSAGQNADLARRDVVAHRELIEAMYAPTWGS
ncbi:MAG: peptidylprolyl isomerase [Gemmatimonadota bacterium]